MEQKMQHRSRAHMFQIQVRALIKTLKCLQSDDKYQALLFLISAIKLYVKFLYNDCQERLYKPAILKELNNIENVIVVNLLKSRSTAASGCASSVATARTSASSYGGGLASASCLDLGSTSIRSTDLSLGGDGLLLMHPHRTHRTPLAPWDLRGKLLRGNLFNGLPVTDSVRLGACISAAAGSSLLKGGHRLASAGRWLGNVRLTRAVVRMIANHDFKLLFNMFEQNIFPMWKIYKNEQIFARKRPALRTVTVRTSLPAICYGSGSSHSPPATYIKKEDFDFDPPYSMADDHCFEEIKDEDDDDLLLMKEDDSIDNSNEIFSEEESSTNNTSLMLSSDTNTLDTNDSSMVSHERNKEQIYQCLLCDKSYRKRKSLVIHFNHHPGFCPDCGKQRGVTSDEIVEHNRIYHKNRPHICEHCGETFTRNQQYQIHVQGHFISQKRVAEQNCKKIHKHCCKTCGIVFNNQKYLEKHIQKTNHQTESLVCDICGAIFCNSIKLSQHVTRMHNNAFTQKSPLERSMLLQQSTSNVEKSFSCDQCGLSFLSETTLREHTKLTHSSPSEDIKMSQTVTDNKFECNICNKLFAAKRSLKRHKLCHSEERAFRCTVENCKDAYKNQSHLARHMKTVHHIEPQKRLPKGKLAAAATAVSGGSSIDPARASSASADFIAHGIEGVAMGGGSCDSLKVGGGSGGTLKKSALGSSEKSLGDSSTNFSDNMSSFNYEFSDTTGGGGSSTPALPSLGSGREEPPCPPTLLSSSLLSGSGTIAPTARNSVPHPCAPTAGQPGTFNDAGIGFGASKQHQQQLQQQHQQHQQQQQQHQHQQQQQQQHSHLQQQHLSWQNLEFGATPQQRTATLPGGGVVAGVGPMQPMQDPLATPGTFMDGGHHKQHHNLHQTHHQGMGAGKMGDTMGSAGSFMGANMLPSGPRRFPLPETSLTCEHCDETNFLNAQQFQVHIQDHFSLKDGKDQGKKMLRLICKTCNLVFATGAQLDRHIQKTNHHTESIVCEVCSAIFNSNLKVYQHMLKCHKNEVWFSCEQCSKVFMQKQDYDKHQLVHQTVTDRSVICEHCASSFLTQEALKEHIKIAHSMDKKYKCTICNKLFAARRSLKRHKLCHEEEAAFRCPIDGCSEAFRTAGNLAKHKKMAHPPGLLPTLPTAAAAATTSAGTNAMLHDHQLGEKVPGGAAMGPNAKLPGALAGGTIPPTASGTMKGMEKPHQDMGGASNAGMGVMGVPQHAASPLMAMNSTVVKTEPRPSAGMMGVPPSRTSSAGSGSGLGAASNSGVGAGAGTNMPYNPYDTGAGGMQHYNNVLGMSPGSNMGAGGHGVVAGPHHHALHQHHHLQQQQQQAHPHHHQQSQFVGMTGNATGAAASMHYNPSPHGTTGSRSGSGSGSSNPEQQLQPLAAGSAGYRMASADNGASTGTASGTSGAIPYGYGQMSNNAFDWQGMAEMSSQTGGGAEATATIGVGGAAGGSGSTVRPTQTPPVSAGTMKSTASGKYFNAMHDSSPGGSTSSGGSTGGGGGGTTGAAAATNAGFLSPQQLQHQSPHHAQHHLQQHSQQSQVQQQQSHLPHHTHQAPAVGLQGKTTQDHSHQQQQQQHMMNMNNQDMMGYQDMWNANMMKMEFQEEGTGGNAAASGAYNSLGNILTNLEMIGSSGSFDAQQQQQQQQQQQGFDMMATARTTADPHSQARGQSGQSPAALAQQQQQQQHHQQQQQQLHQQSHSKGSHFHGKQQHQQHPGHSHLLPTVEPGQMVNHQQHHQQQLLHHQQQQQQQLQHHHHHHQQSQQQFFQEHQHGSHQQQQQQQQQVIPHSHHSGTMGHSSMGGGHHLHGHGQLQQQPSPHQQHHPHHHQQQHHQHHLHQQQQQQQLMYNSHMPHHPQMSQHHPHAPGPPGQVVGPGGGGGGPAGTSNASTTGSTHHPQHPPHHGVPGQQQQQPGGMSYNHPAQPQGEHGNGGANAAATLPTDVAKAQGTNNLPFVDSFTESIDYLQQSFQYV